MKRFLLVVAFLLFSNVARAEEKNFSDYTVSDVYTMQSLQPYSIDYKSVYFVNYYLGVRDGYSIAIAKENKEATKCMNDKPLIFWFDRVMDLFKSNKINGSERFLIHFLAIMNEMCGVRL